MSLAEYLSPASLTSAYMQEILIFVLFRFKSIFKGAAYKATGFLLLMQFYLKSALQFDINAPWLHITSAACVFRPENAIQEGNSPFNKTTIRKPYVLLTVLWFSNFIFSNKRDLFKESFI